MLSKSLRFRIIMEIMLVGTAIITIGIIIGLLTTEPKIEKTIEADLDEIVSMADTLITSEMDLLREKGITLAGSIAYMDDTQEITDKLNAQTFAIEYESIIAATLFDRKGIVTSVGEYPTSAELINDVYIQEAFKGNTVLSTIRIDQATGNLVLHICTPAGKDRVLVATVDGYFFYDILSNYKIRDTGHIFLTDRDGLMISNPRRHWIIQKVNLIEEAKTNPEYEGVAKMLVKMTNGEQGIAKYTLNGVERICSYRPVTGSLLGWSLGAVAPVTEGPTHDIRQGFIHLGVYCFLMLIIAACFLSIPTVNRFKVIESLKGEADRASQSKSSFLANMSHEMRTPLNAIIGLTELTLSDDSNQVERKQNLIKVYSAGMNLLGIINNILDISKIESGKIELIPVLYDTPSIINDTIAINKVRIGSRQIDFVVHVDASFPAKLIGDNLRIKQIFTNLISNAFKYTHEGTVTWEIAFERDGDDVLLISRIEDTGIGITPENIEKLFDDFSRVDAKANRGTEGTGLGLAITKRLVEMMGGTITVTSEYGKGSIFTVTIKQKYVDDVVLGPDLAKRLREHTYTEDKRNRSTRLIRKQMPYARVLIVDDVSANIDVATGMMRPYGLTIDCVTDGQSAINLIRDGSVKYDAVFMDHMMPGMDGIEAVRIIREEIGTDYAKNLIIIAFTANAILGNEDMFLSKGFHAFISKPLDILQLDTLLNTWVRNKDKENLFAQEKLSVQNASDSSFESSDALILEKLKEIDGLNVPAGLERLGANEEVYLSILASYVNSTLPLIDSIREVSADTLKEYAIIVHGIKSSSYSMEANALGTDAEFLEYAAEAENLEMVKKRNPGFLEKADHFLAAIQEILSRRASDKELRKEPDKKLLDGIRSAAGKFDINTAEKLLMQLETYNYEEGAELIVWIREQLDIGALKVIARRLSEEE